MSTPESTKWTVAPDHLTPYARACAGPCEAGESGQQGRVHVDHAAGVTFEEVVVQYPHESGQRNEFDAVLLQNFNVALLGLGRQLRPESSRWYVDGGDAGLACARQRVRVGHVTQNHGDLDVGLAPERAVDHRLKVRASSGGQDTHLESLHASPPFSSAVSSRSPRLDT